MSQSLSLSLTRSSTSSAPLAIAKRANAVAYWDASSMRTTGDVYPSYRDGLAGLVDLTDNGNDLAQGTSNLQPESLPLVGGEGNFHSPGTSDNYASVPLAGVWTAFGVEWADERDINTSSSAVAVLGLGGASPNYIGLLLGTVTATWSDETVSFASSGSGRVRLSTDDLTAGGRYDISITQESGIYSATSDTLSISVDGSGDPESATSVIIGSRLSGIGSLLGRVWWVSVSTASEMVSVDFAKAPHLASSFVCDTGQTVTVNKSGNNPAAVIARDIARTESGKTLSGDMGVDTASYKAVSVYYDISAEAIGVRETLVSASDLVSSSGTTLTFGDHPMFWDALAIVPAAEDTTDLKNALARKYNCSIL